MLFALMLCLQWTAWGQATYDYRYWFDQDNTDQHTGTSYSASWQMEVDVSQLSHTYHSIHMQVKDTAGVWSQPVTRYFIKMPVPSESRGYYWLNDDIKARTETAVENGTLNIDVSALDNKLHYIHYQRNDAYNNTTTPLTGYFMKMPDKNSKKTFRYWTDDDFDNVKTAECTDGVMMLDMSGKKDGFHLLYVMGEMDGEQTQIESRVFIKIPQTEGVSELTCLCYIDGTLYKQEDVPASGGVVDWNLDVASLANGFHRIQVQVVTPTGAATDVHDGFFFRTTMDGELGNMKLVYNVDGGEYKSLEGNFGAGLFHFDLDVSELKDGIHRLNYMLMSETGTSTKVNTSFFIKTPVGGPGIASYKYWVNDNDGEAVKVTIDKRQELFSLISLLPVKAQPIRSSCFHFEIADDGTPMMYAKNDFHIQFVDVKYYHLDAVRQYVDYNVGEKIDEFTLLESGKREMKNVPDSNKVHWFCLEAETGDSLAFKTTQAASIQVFSPTGIEQYSVLGSSSVAYGGFNAKETGTYYVAVHDVTGKKSGEIGVDYIKIGKYCVLNNIKNNWGVLPISHFLRLYGNGYGQLESVSLQNADNIINADTISVDDAHNCDVVFNFTGKEEYGEYDLLLKFKDGDSTENVVINDAITLEEPDFGEIKVNIPNRSFSSDNNQIKISITNTSNLTYLYVPFNFAYDNTNNVRDVKFKNFCIETDKELYDKGLKTSMYIDNFKGTGKRARMFVAMIPCIKPHESVSYIVELKSSSSYNFYSWTGTPWNLYAGETMNDIQRIANDKYGEGGSGGSDSGGSTGNAGSSDGSASGTGGSGGSSGGSGTSGGSGSSGGSGGSASGSGTSGGGSSSGGNGGSSGGGPVVSGAIFLPGSYGGGNAAGNGTGNIMASCMPDPCEYASIFDNQLAECTCAMTYNLGSVFGNIILALKNRQSMAYRQAYGDLVDDDIAPLYRLRDPSDFLWNMADHCLPGILGELVGPLNALREQIGEDPCPEVPDFPVYNIRSYDPNDMKGYTAESGSKAVKKDQRELFYTIEFENDTAFATASAQDVYLTDTLNGQYLDLESFAPTSLKIGDKKVELDGKPNFVTTVDMRPSINAIAQVECNYDSKTGIAKWHFSSLDPMTMEPVENPMDGFLPINNSDGDGMGEVSFNINLKDDFEDGTEIKNRASIVFDYNDAIITPTWTNIIDATAPISRAADIEHSSDSTAVLSIEATDELSGMWRYDVYVQYGSGAWFLAAENVPADTTATVKIYEGIDHGFYVVATDSAGNVEQKEPMRELSYNLTSVLKGDANDDGRVSIVDVTMTINAILNRKDDNFNAEAADMNVDGRISIVDATMIINVILNK